MIYEIFPRSFQDSDGDGIGDLQGVISRLDYLNDGTPNSLGVDAIWLTPIFPSPSYHGYDILDYQAIRSEYGDLNVLKKLIVEAHKRGIRVLARYRRQSYVDSASVVSGSESLPLVPAAARLALGSGPLEQVQRRILLFELQRGDARSQLAEPANSVLVSKMYSNSGCPSGVDGFRFDAAKFLD